MQGEQSLYLYIGGNIRSMVFLARVVAEIMMKNPAQQPASITEDISAGHPVRM